MRREDAGGGGRKIGFNPNHYMHSHICGCGAVAKSIPQHPIFWVRFETALQTIFVLNKLQIRWHPLRACVSIPAVSEQECQNLPPLRNLSAHGPLARHVKLRVAHAPGTFYPSPWARDPDMHHGTCVTHVPWCMPGSLTSGFLWSRWRGKRSRHSQRMRNQQFYVSGKRPMGERSLGGTGTRWFLDFQAIWLALLRGANVCSLPIFLYEISFLREWRFPKGKLVLRSFHGDNLLLYRTRLPLGKLHSPPPKKTYFIQKLQTHIGKRWICTKCCWATALPSPTQV